MLIDFKINDFNKLYLLKYYSKKFANKFNILYKDKIQELKKQIEESEDIKDDQKELIFNLIATEEQKINKKKNKNIKKEDTVSINAEDLEHYIQTILITIDDRELLQDENGFLYEKDEYFTIIGRIITNDDETNTIEWFN